MYLINRLFIRKVKHQLIKKYRFYSKTNAFKNRYKNIDKSLFDDNLGSEVIKRYRDKWNVFGVEVETNTFLLCYNLSGKVDYNIVPENIFAAIIEPSLNKHKDKELSFLSVKNIYGKWFDNKEIFPKSYFHKIDGVFYDEQFNLIENIKSFLESEEFDYPLVCKPSMDTYGGEGVKFINNLDEIKKSLSTYENLVFQEKILQNKAIDKINAGMSTIRTCLYRTKCGKFKVLNNSIRFGVDGSLDNLTAGGLVCNIKDSSTLNNYAVNKYCEKHTMHPNSNVIFSDVIIPFYNDLSEVAETIANEMPLCNLVSLDMCLDINNNWRCIEINIAGQTIRFSQYAGRGFFGNYTDEIINRIINKE